MCDSLAQGGEEEREWRREETHKGLLGGLLQVNVATTHFFVSCYFFFFLLFFLKGLSNDVVICCLIAGMAEG